MDLAQASQYSWEAGSKGLSFLRNLSPIFHNGTTEVAGSQLGGSRHAEKDLVVRSIIHHEEKPAWNSSRQIPLTIGRHSENSTLSCPGPLFTSGIVTHMSISLFPSLNWYSHESLCLLAFTLWSTVGLHLGLKSINKVPLGVYSKKIGRSENTWVTQRFQGGQDWSTYL